MSTQNKDKSPVKEQPSSAPNKGNSAVEQHSDRSSKKGGEEEEKRKGVVKPTATGKDQQAAKPKTERQNDRDRTNSTKKH